jgi:AraC-like DNA-binding protein
MHTLSTAFVNLIVKALSAQGISLAGQLDKADSSLCDALPRGKPISLVEIYRRLSHLSALTQNPDIGLSAYTHMHPCFLGAQCYGALSSPTLGAALQCIVENHVLVTNGSRLLLEQADDHIKLIGIETLGTTERAPRAFLDIGHALMLGLIHWLLPYQKIMPLEVAFSYPRPADTGKLEALFGSNLHFSAPHNSMTFSSQINQLPLPTANPTLHSQHQEFLRNCVLETQNQSLAARVRLILAEQIAQGLPCSLVNTAQLLGTTPRALQNALEREQVTYTVLQDEARLKAAHSLLCHSTRPLKYIATMLGFNEPSSFHKACLRWFGMPPMHYRRYAGTAPATADTTAE